MAPICSKESEILATFSRYLCQLSLFPPLENECLALVNLLDETRLKWKAALAEVEELKEANAVLQERLKLCQMQLSVMVKDVVQNRRRKNEADVSMTLSTIDSDDENQEEMNIDVPEQNSTYTKSESDQKPAGEISEDIVEVTNPSELSIDGQKQRFSEESKLRRSVSLPGLALSHRKSVSLPPAANLDIARCTSAVHLHPRPHIVRRYQDVVEKRPHQFGIRRIFTKLSCMTCKESFRFGNEASRCKVCKLICHPKCRRKVTMACIPFKEVQKPSNGRLKLLDYCSDARPRIPHPIIRCVTVLDGMLESTNLYVHEANPEAVRVLCLNLIYSKNLTKFEGYSAKLISQALLKFLSELREPVILKTSSDEFLTACENAKNSELESVIMDLPKPHRNTLAYLCLHFKRILEKSHINGLNSFMIASKIISVLMRVNMDLANSEKYINSFIRLVNLDKLFYEKVIEKDAQESNNSVFYETKNFYDIRTEMKS